MKMQLITRGPARAAVPLAAAHSEHPPHDVDLRADRADLNKPQSIILGLAQTDTESGDVEATLTSAAVSLDHPYMTPAEHNNPLEPHATTAIWSDEGLTLYDANHGAHFIRDAAATAFRLPPERAPGLA